MILDVRYFVPWLRWPLLGETRAYQGYSNQVGLVGGIRGRCEDNGTCSSNRLGGNRVAQITFSSLSLLLFIIRQCARRMTASLPEVDHLTNLKPRKTAPLLPIYPDSVKELVVLQEDLDKMASEGKIQLSQSAAGPLFYQCYNPTEGYAYAWIAMDWTGRPWKIGTPYH